MERFWLWLKAFLSNWWDEYEKSAIHTAMWVDGYTDWEIYEEICKRFPDEKNSAE